MANKLNANSPHEQPNNQRVLGKGFGTTSFKKTSETAKAPEANVNIALSKLLAVSCRAAKGRASLQDKVVILVLLADVRNLCGHNKSRELNSDEVTELIDGVEKLTKTLS